MTKKPMEMPDKDKCESMSQYRRLMYMREEEQRTGEIVDFKEIADLQECPECGVWHGEDETICGMCRKSAKLGKQQNKGE